MSEFWTMAAREFQGVVDACRNGDGFLTIRPKAGGGNLTYTMTVHGTSFEDEVVSGLAQPPIVYEIPLSKGEYFLEFSHPTPVLLSWRPAGSG